MSTHFTAVVAAGMVLCGLSQAASAGAQAPAQVRSTGVVAGQVIDETTRRPVGGAVVTLTAVAAPGQPAIPAAQARRGAAVANAEGRFVFRDVPAGAYALAATMNNYSPGATGRQRPGGPSGTFTLAEDARLTDVAISMWRLASISGTVPWRVLPGGRHRDRTRRSHGRAFSRDVDSARTEGDDRRGRDQTSGPAHGPPRAG